ncbi:MAG: DUF4179 domain-containing protein [Lachnospiraceae bacterium]|nr:DUF4179 domain-containing protein [Lachnospiraceae bacterium]
MEKKICELLNDVEMDFGKYEAEELPPLEKKRLKKRLLWEVRQMDKNRKTNRVKKGWKVAGIAAAACMAVSVVAVGSNPVAARELFSQTFQKIISGTEGEKDGDELKEIYTKIGEESVPAKAEGQKSVLMAEDSGVTVRVSDIYCDGYMLYYTLEVKTDHPELTKKGVDGISTFDGAKEYEACRIEIDGNDESFPISFKKQSDGTFTSVQSYNCYTSENPKEYQNGDTIPVKLDMKQFLGYDYDKHDKSGEYVHTEIVKGNWGLSFEAVVDTSQNVERKIDKESNGVKIVKAVRTKAALNLELELPNFAAEPFNDKYNDPDEEFLGKDGKSVRWLSNYIKMNKDGSSVMYVTLLDDGGEDYRLVVTNKNVDGRKLADIKFKVKR